MVGKSARYYRNNPEARKRKAKTDKAINSRKNQIRKRVEANRTRRRAKAKGKDVRGLDASHTKNGMRFKKTSKNRGSKSDSAGDRKARGGKKYKK